MASSDDINYATRPNKTVERKLIFEVLATLSPTLNFATYRYIGLGALWFVDFVMAHKILSISDMISIEKNEILAARADFNKPYGCITVEPGESEKVLPGLEIEEGPVLAWLDYDTSLNGPVLKDLSVLCRRALLGSVLIVTINADRRSLPDKNENGVEYKNLADRLRAIAGDLVPQTLPKAALQKSGYPPYLASLLFSHMRRAIRTAGRESEHLLPLFNIGYSDNASMITVGAAIIDEARALEATTRLDENNMSAFLDETKQLKIGVPPLTIKEKISLDQLMPCDNAPTEEDVLQLGFRLKPSQIEEYHRYYRYYPTFGEITL